jgi:hypothetical protein
MASDGIDQSRRRWRRVHNPVGSCQTRLTRAQDAAAAHGISCATSERRVGRLGADPPWCPLRLDSGRERNSVSTVNVRDDHALQSDEYQSIVLTQANMSTSPSNPHAMRRPTDGRRRHVQASGRVEKSVGESDAALSSFGRLPMIHNPSFLIFGSETPSPSYSTYAYVVRDYASCCLHARIFRGCEKSHRTGIGRTRYEPNPTARQISSLPPQRTARKLAAEPLGRHAHVHICAGAECAHRLIAYTSVCCDCRSCIEYGLKVGAVRSQDELRGVWPYATSKRGGGGVVAVGKGSSVMWAG